eukprot:g11456.t2
MLVRSAIAISVAPPKLLRTIHAPMAWRASLRRARSSSGSGPPIMPRMMAQAGQRAGDDTRPYAAAAAADAAAVAGAEGGLLHPPRLAPPPPDVVRHAYSPRAGPLWSSVAAFLGWNEERARELVEFGGVYYKPTSAPVTAKPKREIDPDRKVEIGEYLRIFPEPRRYPSFVGVDWESKIVYESPNVMFVNKPSGVPAHATVDNFGENMLAGIREVRPDLELFLPHRLDIDTSGLVIVAKDQETLRSINDVIKTPGLSLKADGESPRARKARNKALRRAAAVLTDRNATDTLTAVEAGAPEASNDHERAGLPPAGSIKKRYRALVEVLPGSSPLKASPDPLTHFQRVSHRAPKEFRREPPQQQPQQPVGNASGEEIGPQEGETWIECRLRVASATDAFLPARAEETPRGKVADADGSGTGSSSGNEHRNRLQEVEVELLTGRTHQIRGQLAAEGCPIYGDLLYGSPPKRTTEPSPSCAASAAASAPLRAAPPAAGPLGDMGGSLILRRDSSLPPPLSSLRSEESRIPLPSSLGGDLGGGGGGGGEGNGKNDSAADFDSASKIEHIVPTPRLQPQQNGFVESPDMALQACHVALEFDGDSGERERHSFTLGRESCWWVAEEPWVAAGLP